ncbi:MAG TPA: hypothetical protein VLJ37_06270 [bacterium]|nr:hypothetical protein [bacterium]
MSTAVPNLAFLPVSGLSPGQVSLLNYVHTMGSFDEAPFSRSAFSPLNLSARMEVEIRERRRSPVDAVFLSAASLVARTVKQERLLTGILGETWYSESRFVPAVESELTTLRRVIGEARTELKAWRGALQGYRFDGIQDAGEAFDLSLEEPLGSLLFEMQLEFLRRIVDAREILEDYGARSLAGIEAYFNVSRVRKSGPIARIRDEATGGSGKIPG